MVSDGESSNVVALTRTDQGANLSGVRPSGPLHEGLHTMAITVASRRAYARMALGILLLVLGATLLAVGPADAQSATLRVPQDFATVQAAVDAAKAGDIVLIDKGVYKEEVFIAPEHPGNFTIRGVDRNEVIFDGEFTMGTAIEAQADNVVMENMTARNYSGNGFYWQSVDGFRGSYLTAYRIGVYAIFSFDAINGIFEHSYASGSADAAYYVGQCIPCNIVLTDLVAEYSALGYSGTNAGGNLIIKDSLWQNNGTGILPNSLTTEANPPQREATIINNTLIDNDNPDTPAKGLSGSLIGVGIGIAGGNDNVVEGNTITGHDKYGIAIFPLPEDPQNTWIPVGNQIKNNTVSGSGEADLTITQGSGDGNCFAGNTFGTSDPPFIEDQFPCEGPGFNQLPAGSGSPTSAGILANDFAQAQAGNRPTKSYEEMPDAPPQQNSPAVQAQQQQQDPAPEPTPAPALPTTGGGIVLTLLGAGLLASSLRLRGRAG